MKGLYETMYGHYVSQYNAVKYVDYRKDQKDSSLQKENNKNGRKKTK